MVFFVLFERTNGGANNIIKRKKKGREEGEQENEYSRKRERKERVPFGTIVPSFFISVRASSRDARQKILRLNGAKRLNFRTF